MNVSLVTLIDGETIAKVFAISPVLGAVIKLMDIAVNVEAGFGEATVLTCAMTQNVNNAL